MRPSWDETALLQVWEGIGAADRASVRQTVCPCLRCLVSDGPKCVFFLLGLCIHDVGRYSCLCGVLGGYVFASYGHIDIIGSACPCRHLLDSIPQWTDTPHPCAYVFDESRRGRWVGGWMLAVSVARSAELTGRPVALCLSVCLSVSPEVHVLEVYVTTSPCMYYIWTLHSIPSVSCSCSPAYICGALRTRTYT